jgi:hypothetical protein
MDPAEAGIVEQAMGLAGHARGGAGADAAAYARYGGGYGGRYADPRDAVAGGEWAYKHRAWRAGWLLYLGRRVIALVPIILHP